MAEQRYIQVFGAREHNLKNVTVRIPHNQLTVITGMSGSGKSTLAFDTLYAEGQRRYIETFSVYARNFLGGGERPDVDEITGLNPVIAIEQKTTNRNPRSTVGTVTEIYDYLRLLFARAGEAYSYLSGAKMVRYTEEQILQVVQTDYADQRIYLLAPMVRNRKGHYRELFEQLRKKGYLHVRIDGRLQEILPEMRLDRYKNHDIEVVIDRLQVREQDEARLKRSLHTALTQGEGVAAVCEADSDKIRFLSKHLMCPSTGLSYSDPAPHDFSFNSPKGCCKHCHGTGIVTRMDREKLIPNEKLSIRDGAIAPFGKYKNTLLFLQLQSICEEAGYSLNTPVGELPEEVLHTLLYGSEQMLLIKNPIEGMRPLSSRYNGLAAYLEEIREEDSPAALRKWSEQFSETVVCSACGGTRLKKESLFYRIHDKNIAELASMDIAELQQWLTALPPHLNEKQRTIATEILKEIQTRLSFLTEVGLHYLSLNRPADSLSGGESQRIRLATQIGAQLVHVSYILDEPSIGLHPRDNAQLIASLKHLRDIGNTVIVVEHDKDMMLAADYLIDMGPRAGRLGGEVVFQGTPQAMLQSGSLTADYINGKKCIPIPTTHRQGNGQCLRLRGACGNNLKRIDVDIPLGQFIVVTGVSGSGKSSLIIGTLQALLSKHFYRSLKDPLPYDSIEGMEHIDKVIAVDQSPIGRTPRSNPATYTGLFADIRQLFVSLPEAQIRGYKPGRFSFNVKGGRCETCGGNGYKKLEMGFMADVYVPCEACHGKRYNRETLEVRFKGKSIGDVLDMTINQAVEFFEHIPHLLQKLKVLQQVGLGYIKLGQSSTTLSGGENQRLKLAAELSRRDTGNTLYILDEPTTGLHFEDINVLLHVLDCLVDRGNSLIVIEHNTDVIRHADYLIDMGPEGGREGGRVMCTGTPEAVAQSGIGQTAPYIFDEKR